MLMDISEPCMSLRTAGVRRTCQNVLWSVISE